MNCIRVIPYGVKYKKKPSVDTGARKYVGMFCLNLQE